MKFNSFKVYDEEFLKDLNIFADYYYNADRDLKFVLVITFLEILYHKYCNSPHKDLILALFELAKYNCFPFDKRIFYNIIEDYFNKGILPTME